MAVILFTSGTTSDAKAVMLCHRNLSANLQDMDAVLYNITSEDRMLSFLPIHHVFECSAGFLLSLYKGMCTSFADGPRHIVENIKEYANWHKEHLTEDIEDYIDDDKVNNADIIGELKEEREHWKDIFRILNNEKTYINYKLMI